MGGEVEGVGEGRGIWDKNTSIWLSRDQVNIQCQIGIASC